MSKKSSKNNDELNESQIEKEETTKENTDQKEEIKKEKPILPRKRLITKNIQLYASAGVMLFVLLALLVWKMFFDQSIFGKWHFTMEGEYSADYEYVETPDSAEETEMQEYSQLVVYEFTKDGECNVTLGSMTVKGGYGLASTEEYGNVLTVSVYYGSNPILYGTYAYKIEGNVFTGKKLVLTDAYDEEEEPQVLEKGEGDDVLSPFENPQLDSKLNGTWYDSTNDITYEFKSNGEMIRTMSDSFSVRHYYTIMQDNVILVKFMSDSEQNETYGYEFIDDTLYIDQYELVKLD